MDYLREIIRRNRAGEPVALPSVCSAHPDVLRASLLLAQEHDRPLLIEATSNQVNQFGGYTGLRPVDFVHFVHAICDTIGFRREGVLIGGDHLGPQAWKSEPAEVAMTRAEEMVRAYVAAGFTKIHLDCSEGCQDEPPQVGDEMAAVRAARLAAACEEAAPDSAQLSYVVGTEVPPPGGPAPPRTTLSSPPHPRLRPLQSRSTAGSFATAASPQLGSVWSGLSCSPGSSSDPPTSITCRSTGQTV